ncbi:flagellar motor switch protein FliG [Malonomonas rubra DSM 5091]|uniref:Flagellar motor switch protein FliG n=1 Tax=Malonomonas rubra DSM 5091 TaxID=1122189 RepID=A0A1M6MD42_MALRU|nr:flagellar motor switch protein FliG [Malonomonas rubra]SHJ81375.1 flagellar motor switch protein FliG [Malonomonas rubra DSM 5091]
MLKAKHLSGAKKAALLLLCLGEEATAKIFEALDDSEVREISRCMMDIDHVDPKVAREILEEFKTARDGDIGVYIRGEEFAKHAILGGANNERAQQLLDQVSAGIEGRPLETISKMHPRMVAGLLENEHPQTVALILSTQKEDHTSRILAELPDDARGEIMYRIAKIDNVSPEVINQIEDALQREIGVASGTDRKQVGGIEKVVEILSKMEKGADQVILTSIEAADPDMAEDIRRLMFTFEDLVTIDNRGMQAILREVSTDMLTLALKTASDAIKQKIFGNISERAADMIAEDLEAMGPRKLSEVEAMQMEVVKVALKLEEDGSIVIPGRGGGGDELV